MDPDKVPIRDILANLKGLVLESIRMAGEERIVAAGKHEKRLEEVLNYLNDYVSKRVAKEA